MGIQGLMKVLSEECPEAIKELELDSFTGRKIAIDASMAIYQFLIAVRSNGPGNPSAMLMNEAGEVTSHIQVLLLYFTFLPYIYSTINYLGDV